MLSGEKLKISAEELNAALDVGPSGGKQCQTLGEVLEFITKLVSDDAVLRTIGDPDRQYPEVEPHRWWFRGARHDRYGLDAGLFRTSLTDVSYPGETKSYGRLEQRIRHEYSLMTRGRFPGATSDAWDQLFEMQHYGLPTRLLDWTFSLGQALWFALRPPETKLSGPHSTQDEMRPVIWILNPRLLAKASLGAAGLDDFSYLERYGTTDQMRGWNPKPRVLKANDGASTRSPGWLLDWLSRHTSQGHFPVLASWTNPRMAAQMGCFTLQSGVGKSKTPSLDVYAKTASPNRFLFKICLEPDENLVNKAYRALSLIGVNKYTLFPEIHETCAWIKELRNLRR